MFINFSDAQGDADEDGFDLLEVLGAANTDGWQQSAEQSLMQSQTMAEIESEIEKLPPRQREAFLLRYWEELDIAETASAMGCSEGSVKTHCFRAIQTLANVLKSKKSKP
jgi:RNA polymerase sigma-70 factor (ECF subfamily)